MKPQIAIIAPYGALKGEARAAVEELGLNVLVREGDLAEGVRAAQRAVRDGVEVLISRGGSPWGFTDYGKPEKSPKPINCKPGSDRFAM